jgi:mannose/fructose/N-acetylgalactosamine-specific phosphotransferase system component IIC
MNARSTKGDIGIFEAILRWALGSMFGHMAFFTLIVAVPLAIWLCAELHAVNALTLVTALVMLGLSIAGGLMAAYGLWRFYFKSRRLPPR